MILFFIVFFCQSFLKISLLLLMFIVVGSLWYSDCCFCNQCEKMNLFLIIHHFEEIFTFFRPYPSLITGTNAHFPFCRVVPSPRAAEKKCIYSTTVDR